MDQLESAWRSREVEREAAVNKAVTAHRQAEAKLTQSLFDCEQREQLVKLKEQRLQKEKSDVERDCERKIQESEDTCRRVREEYVHQCALEMEKQKDLTKDNARLAERLDGAEEERRTMESEFTRYKELVRGTPEMELRGQVTPPASVPPPPPTCVCACACACACACVLRPTARLCSSC